MGQGMLAWCLAADGVLLLLMGWDKRAARTGRRRVPERTLLAWAVLGGAGGGWLGMRLFHHKTRHWYFRWGLPLLTLLDGLGLLVLL